MTADHQSLSKHYKNSKGPVVLKSFENSAQIVIIRHARPAVDKSGFYSYQDLKCFHRDYDESNIIHPESNPIELPEPVDVVIYHSDLPRARQTARAIFNNSEQIIEEDRFRELERGPVPAFPFRLPVKIWSWVSRLLWRLGRVAAGADSYRNSLERARENALFLERSAMDRGMVILVSHGLHNHFLIKFLKQQGWKSVLRQPQRYLSVNILAKQKN